MLTRHFQHHLHILEVVFLKAIEKTVPYRYHTTEASHVLVWEFVAANSTPDIVL